MKIIGLHKNIYKLARHFSLSDAIQEHKSHIEKFVQDWEKLKAEGVCAKTCQEILGISRATFYRYKRQLKLFRKSILSSSRRPRSFRKPRWGESEKQWVLRIRRENPTYGKEKIAVILKRDYGLTLSESTVGRIITALITKGLISPSSKEKTTI